MNDLDVRIVRLEPMRVAAAHGFGANPEDIAWDKTLAFAKSKGLLGGDARFFGFNNPDPSPGSPNYGYEQWITVADEVEGDDHIEIKTFDGGLYAVTRWEGTPNPDIWRKLVSWCENNGYRLAHHQWLEEMVSIPESLGESAKFDLYAPITR